MTPFDWLLVSGVAASLGLVAYAYVGYPVVIWILSRVFGRPPRRPEVADEDLPSVTLLIAAYNEEHEIRRRIENALTTDYPIGKFEIVIASDGSDDATNAIVRQYAKRGVRLLAFPRRRGKAAVLNDAIPSASGELVMLSDANTVSNPESARQMASWFVDPKVGVVCGRLVLTDPIAGRNVDGIYWKYETFLKKCESRLGALLGSNGGIYAIRRSVYSAIPDNTLVDDFIIPLLARNRTGCRIIYDRDAVACEETPEGMTSEFHRRARIGAGGFQSIGILRSLLNPKNGWVAFTFVSHKVLRWLGPFLLAFAMLGSAALAVSGLAQGDSGLLTLGTVALIAQLAFYASSFCSAFVPARPRFLRVLRLPAMFTLMNAALAVGFFRWLSQNQNGAWRRTARASELTLSEDTENTDRIPAPIEFGADDDDSPSAVFISPGTGS